MIKMFLSINFYVLTFNEKRNIWLPHWGGRCKLVYIDNKISGKCFIDILCTHTKFGHILYILYILRTKNISDIICTKEYVDILYEKKENI